MKNMIMKRTGKYIAFLVAAVLLLSVGAGLAGCGSGGKTTKTEKLELQKTAELFEEEQLSLTARVISGDGEEVAADIEWSSDKPGVLTVLDGVITGIMPGTATVTAKSGTLSADCNVTVKDKGYYPVLSLNMSERLNMANGGEFTGVAVVTHRGKPVTEFSGSWQSAKSDTVEVTSVSEGGKSAVLKAKKAGAATLTVLAEYRGEQLKKEVKVFVLDGDIDFNLTGTGLSGGMGKYSLNLVKHSFGEKLTETTLAAAVKKAGVNVPNPGVEWTTGDAAVATVSAAGKISAVGVGETDVTAKYTSPAGVEYELNVAVSVSLEKKSMSRVYFDRSQTAQPFSVTYDLQQGEKVVAYRLDKRDVTSRITVSGTTVTFDKSTTAVGEYDFVIETDFGVYAYPLIVCDKAISTPAELRAMESYCQKLPAGIKGDQVDGKTFDVYFWTGYLALKNDIDLAGAAFEDFCDYVSCGYSASNLSGFRGTFNGCGYTIKNLTITKASGGLFGNMGSGSEFKNVNIVNADNQGLGGVVCNYSFGTISNVFVSGKYSGVPNSSAGASMLIGKGSGTAVYNVFIVVNGEPEDVADNKFSGAVCRENTLNIKNLIVVGGSALFGEGENDAVTHYAGSGGKDAFLAAGGTVGWPGWEESVHDGTYPAYKG